MKQNQDGEIEQKQIKLLYEMDIYHGEHPITTHGNLEKKHDKRQRKNQANKNSNLTGDKKYTYAARICVIAATNSIKVLRVI